MRSHNVLCTLIVSSAGTCWPEGGLEKTETCSHTRVLMIVCYCYVLMESFYFIVRQAKFISLGITDTY
jgi:hypothetical protein